MVKKLLFATNNLHKLREVKEIIGNSFSILSLKDVSIEEDIPETNKANRERLALFFLVRHFREFPESLQLSPDGGEEGFI